MPTLLQLLYPNNQWRRCRFCSQLCEFSLRCYNRGNLSTDDYCMLCFRTLQPVMLEQSRKPGGD